MTACTCLCVILYANFDGWSGDDGCEHEDATNMDVEEAEIQQRALETQLKVYGYDLCITMGGLHVLQ